MVMTKHLIALTSWREFMCLKYKIVYIGLILGGIFALFVTGTMMPSGLSLGTRAFVWASVMGGPVLGTVWGTDRVHPSIWLGWYGLFLILIHIIYPNKATRCLTILGFFFWYYAGFLTVMVAAWGA